MFETCPCFWKAAISQTHRRSRQGELVHMNGGFGFPLFFVDLPEVVGFGGTLCYSPGCV